jgi:polyisoprenoid-binding protein YceI
MMHRDLFVALLFAVLASAGCGDSAVDSANAGNNGGSAAGGEGNGTPAAGGDAAPADGPGMALDESNTEITFVGTKADGKHDGGFKEFAGRIGLDEASEKVESISVEIQTASLWSDNEKLTAHLKNADFFNVNEHPTAKFESTSIKEEAGELTVVGKLTLLGNTEEITFPAQATVADGKVTLTSEFKIDRSRFGMNYGQGMVDNEVTISVNVGSEAAADGE